MRGAWIAAACVSGCAQLPPVITPSDIATYEPAQFVAAIASAEGAAAERAKAFASIREAERDGASDAAVASALGAVLHHDIEHDAGRRILRRELADPLRPLATRSIEQQRALIAAAHGIHPLGSAPLLAQQLPALATPREFAAAAHVILRADHSAASLAFVRAALAQRRDGDDPRLEALSARIERAAGTAEPPRPPLADLFAASWRAGFPVVYSLQRRDRRQIGLAVVRGADGRFVRDAQGRLLALPQLALAASGLPGTITNGNTPQGLFTIVGAGRASNPWIGPTPYLYSKVPFEATLAEFEHRSDAGEAWTRERYDALLPQSWRGFAPMHEAWLAGRAGRNEMLLHGTTIDAEPYRARSWYPLTPSAGCLVAGESWSAAEGRLLHSDQLTLLKAFTRDGRDRGYLVVVELDDRAAPVALAEVLHEMLAGEVR